MIILVTGGAGFIGSHLCDYLVQQPQNHVICVDNNVTGSLQNIQHLLNLPNFEFIRHDVTVPLHLEVEQIYHLACPASPKSYQHNSIKTIKTNVLGTLNMLGLAKRTGSRILLTSTSEVYGDPNISPQVEEYWGNVNPIGIRACYDEGKRVAETLMTEYHRNHKVDIRIARIFNTYGPRLHKDDGRVVSNFINQCLNGENITIYGDGSQTRSFCYVSDLVQGLVKLMTQIGYHLPVNLGNPEEYTISQLAEAVMTQVKSNSLIEYCDLPEDDPKVRKPDITKARNILGWEPRIGLTQGLQQTINYFLDIKNMNP